MQINSLGHVSKNSPIRVIVFVFGAIVAVVSATMFIVSKNLFLNEFSEGRSVTLVDQREPENVIDRGSLVGTPGLGSERTEPGSQTSQNTMIGISKLVEPSDLSGMENWLASYVDEKSQYREIANASIISIDPSIFDQLIPGQRFQLVLGPNKTLELETGSWRPLRHGGGSWVGIIDKSPGKITLHVNHLGNVEGFIRLPGEAWGIKSAAYLPYHVVYQLVDTVVEVD